MKYFLCLGLLLVFLFSGGCTIDSGGGIQIDSEDRSVLAKIAGRHVGVELEKRYPDIATKASVLCQDIVASEEGKIILGVTNSLIAILADEFIKDPILTADIQDLVALFKIKLGVPITLEQELIIKAAAQGLINGIELQKRIA